MSTAADQPVLVTVEDGVGVVTFNRPDALNSLDLPTKEGLLAALRQVADDPEVRAVVLTGSGRAFCVGQDLKSHVQLLQAQDPALWRTVPEHYNPAVTLVATMRKPVIAAINGVAAGAGASFTFACDYRFMTDGGGYNFAFTTIALSCDTGASWTLPRLVGTARAKELLMFPRTISAQEAKELGLVNEVVEGDVLPPAMALARRMAAGPTLAYAAIRDVVHYSAEHSFAESLAHEGELMDATGSSQDHAAAVAAFLAKERPTFAGR
ncbi:enoyl-CoA hydratase/isomerase family protein [Arsenicicoccus dermatophilus]|uniref:enoyl-CoA hydratase/isomerase family protein n=1 Tax=Arsenicicoccus dermatophilus TaxID=1076331 RepID=UPI001F4D0701|nr:enoyl-CoA hydratase/isomerase family protein [Arsenicicoccus dermatophilus]